MWIKFSASLVASTNQFLIEGVSPVAKKQSAWNQRQTR